MNVIDSRIIICILAKLMARTVLSPAL